MLPWETLRNAEETFCSCYERILWIITLIWKAVVFLLLSLTQVGPYPLSAWRQLGCFLVQQLSALSHRKQWRHHRPVWVDSLTCYSTLTQQNVRKWEEHLEIYMPTSPSSSPERKMGRWESWDGHSPFREHMCWYLLPGSPQSTYAAVHFLGPLYLRQTWNTSINTIPDTKHRCVYNRVIRIDWPTEQTC